MLWRSLETNEDKRHQTITLVLAICSLGSFLSAFYIFISCLVMWKRRKKPSFKGTPAYFLTHHAFYIALCDLVWHLPYFSCNFWFSFAKPNEDPSKLICMVIAVSYQFSGSWMQLWYIALSSTVLYMIKDEKWFFTGISDLQHTLSSQTTVTFILAAISTVIPWQSYGELEEDEYGGRSCWIMDRHYQLILYGWVVISMITDLVLMFYAMRSRRHYKQSQAEITDRVTLHVKFMHRLYYLVIVDSVVWILPLVYRVYILLDKTPQWWLKDIHNILLVCLGMANAAIWSTTEEFESVFRYCKFPRMRSPARRSNSWEDDIYPYEKFLDNASHKSSVQSNVVKSGSEGRESGSFCIENPSSGAGENVRSPLGTPKRPIKFSQSSNVNNKKLSSVDCHTENRAIPGNIIIPTSPIPFQRSTSL